MGNDDRGGIFRSMTLGLDYSYNQTDSSLDAEDSTEHRVMM